MKVQELFEEVGSSLLDEVRLEMKAFAKTYEHPDLKLTYKASSQFGKENKNGPQLTWKEKEYLGSDGKTISAEMNKAIKQITKKIKASKDVKSIDDRGVQGEYISTNSGKIWLLSGAIGDDNGKLTFIDATNWKK